MKKTEAYTVVELIVVMIITSMLVLFIWNGFRFVIFMFHSFSHNVIEYEDLMRLDYLLRNDFFESESIVADRHQNMRGLMFYKEGGACVYYLFEEQRIIRKGVSQVDTIKFGIVNEELRTCTVEQVDSVLVCGFSFEIALKKRQLRLNYSRDF